MFFAGFAVIPTSDAEENIVAEQDQAVTLSLLETNESVTAEKPTLSPTKEPTPRPTEEPVPSPIKESISSPAEAPASASPQTPVLTPTEQPIEVQAVESVPNEISSAEINMQTQTATNSGSSGSNGGDNFGDPIAQGVYIGNRNNHKLHVSTCHSLPKEKNQVIFNSLEEAVNAGYDDYCGNCMK